MLRRKKKTILITSAILAFIHLAFGAYLTLEGGEALMAFLALDYPLVVMNDCFPVVSDVDGWMSRVIPVLPGGVFFALLFGTLMYFGAGLLLGWVIWKITYRKPAKGHSCSTCDYDLTGNVSGICSECGTQIQPVRPIPKAADAEERFC